MTARGDDLSIIGNRVLLSLRPEALAFLQARLITRPLASGEILYEAGAPFSHAIFPHKGVISLLAQMEDGRSIEKGSIGPEGFVGVALLMGGRLSLSQSVVMVPGYASWISLADLDAAYEQFVGVREAMQRYAQAFIIQLMESVACNSLHNAEQRIVRWLLEASDRVGDQTVGITQELLSQALGLRRATVSEVWTRLQNDGLIRHRRGAFLIINRAGMEKRACECYARVRKAFL